MTQPPADHDITQLLDAWHAGDAQARERCHGSTDRGAEFARAAIEMADLFRNLRPKA